MPSKRSYGDVCGVARALDTVGERWALLVVRELLLGPKRFTDLRDGLPHLSPDILSQRLRDLDAAGVLRRRRLPPPAPAQVYELTPLGFELEPVILALGRWGALLPIPPGEQQMSFDAHILSLRTLFDPALAGDLDRRYELRLGERVFRAEVSAGRFEIEPGAAGGPDAILETDHGTLLALVRGGRELGETIASGDGSVTGDREAVERFVGLFPLPPAPVAA